MRDTSIQDFHHYTIDFYNKNASDFYERTVELDVDNLRKRFMRYLPINGTVLDAGCGSGRDTLYFKQAGYSVVAFDASVEMAQRASDLTGIHVKVDTFQNFDSVDCFDGIWACASLLHVSRSEIDDVLERLARSLKHKGILYASFKYGSHEGMRNDRFFNSYDEQAMRSLISAHPKFALLEMWTSVDVRPSRADEKWLDIILQKAQEFPDNSL